jgi:hypothetical protein
MSYYTVGVFDEDGGQVQSNQFETDSETLSMAAHVIGLIEDLDNGEEIRITADIF